MKRLVFLFLLALFHQSSFGAIYKCEQNGKVEYQATQCSKGNDITKKIKPLPAVTPVSEAMPSSTKKCQGKEMSLNFPDITIFTTLHVIADFSGNKLVADPFVGGSGAFYYQCTPWTVVLEDIANKYNLIIKVENGTIFARNR